MKSWYVSSSKDGYFLTCTEYSAFRTSVDSAFGWACHFTRGWLGGHGMPEFLFNIPVGKRQWDEEYEFLENSIAMKFVNLEQRIGDWAYVKEVTRFHTPISKAMAEELAPNLVKTMKELHKD